MAERRMLTTSPMTTVASTALDAIAISASQKTRYEEATTYR